MKRHAGLYIVKDKKLAEHARVLLEAARKRLQAGGWDESQHPRDKDGKFADGGEDGKEALPKGFHTHEAKEALPALHDSWKVHKDWHQQAYGGVLVNRHGEFLLREPTGHFDGYAWTWPKGKMDDKSEHPMDTASREVKQETGYNSAIIGHLPGNYKSGSGANSNFYLMRPKGQNVFEMDNETKGLKWVTYDEAKALIGQSKNYYGRKRDLAILERAHEHLTGKYHFMSEAEMDAAGWDELEHPRDNAGKFTDKADGDELEKMGLVQPVAAPAPKGTSHGHLKEAGYSKVGKENGVSKYTHPTKGTIDYHHATQKIDGKPVDFIHKGLGGEVVHMGHSGKFGSNLKEYLQKSIVAPPQPLKSVLPDNWEKKVDKVVKEEISKHVEQPKPEPVKAPVPPTFTKPEGLPETFTSVHGHPYSWDTVTGFYTSPHSGIALDPHQKDDLAEIKRAITPKEEKAPEPVAHPLPEGMHQQYQDKGGYVATWNETTGKYNIVSPTGESKAAVASPSAVAQLHKGGHLTPLVPGTKPTVAEPTPAPKLPVPDGMHEKYVDKQGNTATWNSTTGKYDTVKSDGSKKNVHTAEWIKDFYGKGLLSPVEVTKPIAPPTPVEQPKPEASKAPPNGLPDSVKGPKGGVYDWNHDKGLYEHKSGKYTMTPDQVGKKLKTGALADAKPSADLASKVPLGMYSHYEKNGGWKAVFNPQTGMYDKYKNGKLVIPDVPKEKMHDQVIADLYHVSKNATVGTGPFDKQSSPAASAPRIAELPKPSAPEPAPVAPSAKDFTYQGSAKGMGGAFDKHIFTDQQGKEWMFKPAQTLGGGTDKLKAHADEVASKIQALVRPDAAIPAKAVTLAVPGKGEQLGSIQKLVDNVAPKKDFTGVNPTQLSAAEFKSLQKEQVVDWLLSNHDAHSGQFVRTTEGKVYGIDKTQMGKWMGKDELSTTYHPNTMEKPPYYNEMWQAVKAGKVDFDPNAVLPTIEKAQAIPDKEYKDILKPYAEARYGSATSKEAAEFLDKAVERKNNLKADFEKLYSEVKGSPFKFPDKEVAPATPEKSVGAKPVSEKTYSEKPNSGSAGVQVSDAMHKTLEDAGYKFAKYGNKTGMPLYKDAEGKAVYVKHNDQFEYYPMGTHGMNAKGAVQSTGAHELSNALAQVVHKGDTSFVLPTAAPIEKLPGTGNVDEIKHYGNNPAPEFKQALPAHAEEMRAMAAELLGAYKGKEAELHYDSIFAWAQKLGLSTHGMYEESSSMQYSNKSKAELIESAKGMGMYAHIAAHFGLEPKDLMDVQNSIRGWSHSSSSSPLAGKMRQAAQELVTGKCCSDRFGKAVALEHAITRAKLLQDKDWKTGEGKLSRALSGKVAEKIKTISQSYDEFNLHLLNAEGFSDNKGFGGQVRLHDDHVSVDHVISSYKTNPNAWSPHYGEHEFIVSIPGAWKMYKSSDVKTHY